jgi:rhomboid protease GlpG
MRLIGHLQDEASARTFGDYLYVQGIENEIESGQDKSWAVWVNEEEKVQTAAALLNDFRQNPSDPKYKSQGQSAEDLRTQKAKTDEAWRKRLHNRRHLFRPLTAYGFGPVTFVLIAISVGVCLLSRFGANVEGLQSLFITQFMSGDSYIRVDPSLHEIRHGEIWRLFTPMFIHFGPIHILFNMLWLRDLGSMIEGRQSSGILLALVLSIAAGSNLAQFYLHHHAPNFGGMSGVVYGLLGYVWLRGKFDPGSGLFLHPSTVTLMLIWLVAGFAGLLGPIANIAHLAGLLMGTVWGYLSSLRFR